MVTIMGLCGGDGVEKITGLGQRLRQLMEERKLNYEELGQRVDMRPQTLNRYVLGQREPKGQVVAELAMKLGVDPLWLQGYDVPRQRESESEKAGQVPVYSLLSGANPFDVQPPEGYAPADLPSGEGYVYLRVTESGMEDAGILPGDQVLIRRQASVRSGQIALVAFASRPAVLRWYYQQGEWVILQPARAGLPPELVAAEQFYSGSVQVLGVAVGLTRRF